MSFTYSIYEAKARFSEVIRQVRAGRTVTISRRGEPVAEIRSVRRPRKPTLDARLEEPERIGSLIRPTAPRRTLQPFERRPGALSRFLAERGEHYRRGQTDPARPVAILPFMNRPAEPKP